MAIYHIVVEIFLLFFVFLFFLLLLCFVPSVNFPHCMLECLQNLGIFLYIPQLKRVTEGSDARGGINRWCWIDDSRDSKHNELIKRLWRMKCQRSLERWQNEMSGNSWFWCDSQQPLLSLESQLFLPQLQQSLMIHTLLLFCLRSSIPAPLCPFSVLPFITFQENFCRFSTSFETGVLYHFGKKPHNESFERGALRTGKLKEFTCTYYPQSWLKICKVPL